MPILKEKTMSKPIPKFLHNELRELIGKSKVNLGDIERLLALSLTTKYQWTERVIQYCNVHYEAEDDRTLADILDDVYELESFRQAFGEGDIERCIDLIADAIDQTEDTFGENRYDYCEEVDRGYLDEDFDHTVDSDVGTTIHLNANDNSIGLELSNWQHSNNLQSRTFSWLNVFNWFVGRRRTPLNASAHTEYLDQEERY